MKNFNEIYVLPFVRYNEGYTWVYDQNNNFCFQFESFNIITEDKYKLLLDVINGKQFLKNPDLFFIHENNKIKDNSGTIWIIIRGWGNLTSPNSLNFTIEEAKNIQNTLAQYIIDKLNYRESGK